MTFAGLVGNIVILGNMAVTLLFALAIVFFIFNVFRYFILAQGNEEAIEKGRKTLIYSAIGFVVLFSLWGIIGILVNTLNSTVGNSGSTNTNQTTTPTPSSVTTGQ
jgi:hypothetical protein